MEIGKLLKQVANEPEKHQNALQKFKETYDGLQIGAYSQDVLSDIIENGTVNIESKFKTAASIQLDKSGIVSPLLKQSLLNGCNEVLQHFKKTIEGLINSAVEHNNKIAFEKITKTQMQVEGLYVGSNCARFIYPTYKKLEIGIGGGLVTKCNKSIDVGYSTIYITPTDDTYYIYARWPRAGGCAFMEVHTQTIENTESDFFMLWKSGSFDEIKF